MTIHQIMSYDSAPLHVLHKNNGRLPTRIMFHEEPWERMPYPRELGPYIREYFKSGKIGSGPIVDLGAGENPISHCVLKERGPHPDRILVDLSLESHLFREQHHGDTAIQADLDMLVQDKQAWESLKRVIMAINGGNVCADTIIASSILNYVGYSRVLHLFDSVFSTGGLLFIGNGIDMGNEGEGNWNLRPKSDEELVDFLGRELKYEIEVQERHYPKDSFDHYYGEFTVIVARKK